MLVYSMGGWGKIPCDAWCSPIWYAKCLAGRFGAGGSLIFSQCNMVWRSFLQARGSENQSFDLLGAVFPQNVAPVSQQGFGVTELMMFVSTP
jgi:hypothetical protein